MTETIVLPSGWHRISRAFGECVAHETLPVWVVEYPSTYVRQRHFQAYIATEKLINGQHPCEGGVDNKAVGPSEGFQTLEAACASAVDRSQTTARS